MWCQVRTDPVGFIAAILTNTPNQLSFLIKFAIFASICMEVITNPSSVVGAMRANRASNISSYTVQSEEKRMLRRRNSEV